LIQEIYLDLLSQQSVLQITHIIFGSSPPLQRFDLAKMLTICFRAVSYTVGARNQGKRGARTSGQRGKKQNCRFLRVVSYVRRYCPHLRFEVCKKITPPTK